MNATATSAGTRCNAPSAPAIESESTSDDVLQRIGVITRHLHDALCELGYNKNKTLEDAVDSLPDARARLSYIAKLTGESADKVLNTVELARVAQDEMRQGANALKARWNGKAWQSLDAPGIEALVTDTNEFLGSLSMSTDLANSYLTEIMMAQDFHDLTGQVIRKVVDLAQTLEEQLLALLLETAPPGRRVKVSPRDADFLNGPVIHSEDRTDIVTSQSQVDDMLESLGF
jgi:chemotaxis protein CheZ